MLATPVPVLAHSAPGSAIDPALLLIVGVGIGYGLTLRSRRAPRPAARQPSRGPRARAGCFYGGLLAVVLATGPPVGTYADELFWVHMVQHVLLMMVAAPLFALAAPWLAPLHLLPRRKRGPVARGIREGAWAAPVRLAGKAMAIPTAAWAAFNLNLLLWHVPALYDLTLRSRPVHDIEHLLFLGLGVVFWARVTDSPPFRSGLDPVRRVAYLTAAILVGWGLSVALATAPRPLYQGYAAFLVRPGGISALTDQRLAAGIMWGPGSVTLAVGVFVYLHRWLGVGARQEAVPEGRTVRAATGGAVEG